MKMVRRRTFPKNHCFVFGSNEAGAHGAGAAKTAQIEYGFPFGKSYGHYSYAFGIPTKDEYIKTMEPHLIEMYIKGFLAYAVGHRKLNFLVTAIGTGLAGLPANIIAPMFILPTNGTPDNCYFDEQWKEWLGEDTKYWGTFK